MVERIYTDGACTNNRCGGWAAIFYTQNGRVIFSGGVYDTTNNRMELKAIIMALRYIMTYPIWQDANLNYEIYTDSNYCFNAIVNKWYERWAKFDWKKPDGKKVKNIDMWRECGNLIRELQDADISISFHKVKGHSGNVRNDLADTLARSESLKIKLGWL